LAGHNNAHYYSKLFGMSITRKKLALLIYDSSLKWVDLEDDDAFNFIFRKYCSQIEVDSVCLPSRGLVIPLSNCFKGANQ